MNLKQLTRLPVLLVLFVLSAVFITTICCRCRCRFSICRTPRDGEINSLKVDNNNERQMLWNVGVSMRHLVSMRDDSLVGITFWRLVTELNFRLLRCRPLQFPSQCSDNSPENLQKYSCRKQRTGDFIQQNLSSDAVTRRWAFCSFELSSAIRVVEWGGLGFLGHCCFFAEVATPRRRQVFFRLRLQHYSRVTSGCRWTRPRSK